MKWPWRVDVVRTARWQVMCEPPGVIDRPLSGDLYPEAIPSGWPAGNVLPTKGLEVARGELWIKANRSRIWRSSRGRPF
jgi:hypothetical protein